MFRGRRLVGPVGLIALIILAACSTADPETSTESSASPSASSTPEASTASSSVPNAPESSAVNLDLPMTLGVATMTARVVEAGSRPVLAWDAVPQAVDYQLIVRDAAGETIWAWSGSTNSIAIGGGTDPASPDTPAALITEPSTWVVIALDRFGVVVAATTDLEVAP